MRVQRLAAGLGRLGYRLVTLTEIGVKKPVFGCQACGQCVLSQTGLICPMRCPKMLRNGPCGGSANGFCEVYPDRPCVWIQINQRAQRLGWTNRLRRLRWPVDWSLKGSSSWMNYLAGKDRPPSHASILTRSATSTTTLPRSALEKALKSGQFVVTAEVGPPRNANPETIRRKVALLRGFVDAVNLTDNQRAVVHMSSLAASVLAQQEGLEAIAQMTARDRNRIALQSDLLGAAALGIRNMLLLTGDHPRHGNHPDAKAVFDLDAAQMVMAARGLRDHGLFLSGDDLKGDPALARPQLFLGVAANPDLEPLEVELLRLERKIDAGAEFVQTQGVFDLARFERWMAAVRERGLHKRAYFLVGVLLVRSARAAQVMKSEVPGIHMPDDFYRRIVEAANPAEEGIRLGIDTVQRLRRIEGVRGVHLMAIGWEEAIPRVVEGAGLLPRPTNVQPAAVA